MRHRKLLTAVAVGSLAALGGFGFTPPEHAGPPDDAPSDNACPGIEQAQDAVDGTPAEDVLERVEEMLADGECDEGPASEQGAGNADDNRPGDS